MFGTHKWVWAATALIATAVPTASAAASTGPSRVGSMANVKQPYVSGNDQRCLTVAGKKECFVTAFNDTIDCSAPVTTTWKNGFAETYVYGGWPATAKMKITWSGTGISGFTGGPSGWNVGTTSASWTSSAHASGLVTLNYSGIQAFGFPLQAETTVTGNYVVHGHNYIYSVNGSKLC